MTTILAAAGTGVLVLLAGNGPTTGLGALNLRLGTSIPWAILPMAVYLLAYWRFLDGGWGESSGAPERRANLRANMLSPGMWGVSLAAGALGFGALLALLIMAARLVRLPSSLPITTPPDMPVWTAFVLLAMQAVVAGVSEEAAFRGYMQSMVERRHGLTVAILASGTLFGLLHFGNHPGDVLLMLPYYVAVSAVYSGLTWAADSILPAVVLHSVGDIVVLTRWWLTGRPEWQIGATLPPLLWEGGIDVSFVLAAFASVLLAVLTARAYGVIHRRRITAIASTPSVNRSASAV